MELPSGGRKSRAASRDSRRESSKWSQEEAMHHLNENSDDRRFDLMREEILASKLMKQLTEKYGTKGKSAKHIFLQAFQEGQRSDAKAHFAKISRPQFVTCEADESMGHGFLDDIEADWEEAVEPLRDELHGNSAFSQLISRPAAMVSQSNFVTRLEEQVKMEIQRAGYAAPQYELGWIHEEVRPEAPNILDTTSAIVAAEPMYETIRDTFDEPEEKMLARLKIYRRAFSALILHFEALRPILKDIKRNYDNMLTLREHQVSEATKVKKNIHHLELSLDEKMAAVQFEGFAELAELEKQCSLLMRHVDRQDLAMRTMTDILNRLETSLSEEHDLRRDSEDQRKLLIVEINDLRRKFGMTPRPATGSSRTRTGDEEDDAERNESMRDDPILLRRALEVTRNNLSEAHNRLAILEADFSDVIPRHEFEELKVVMSSLEVEHSRMIETYNNVNSEVEGLRNQIEKLTGSRNNLQELVTSLNKRATPRPSWEKIAEHIDGGLPKWKSLIDGKSTAEIVPMLIQELTGKKLLGPPEFIHPLGTGPQVPPYLRYDHQVRRRNISRRDVVLVLQDIWQQRAERLELLRRYSEAKEEEASGEYGSTALSDIPGEMPIVLPFPDFVLEYFETRFPVLNMRMEWIYNIVETCKKLGPIDTKLSQFMDILEGRKDESVYHLLRGQVAKLRNAVIQKSEETGQSPGSIQFSHFGEVMREVFGEKTQAEIQGLMTAASKQTGVNAEFSIVNYIAFFALTDEGLVGAFVEEFAKQFEQDRFKYVYEVLAEVLANLGVSLISAERDNDPAGDTDVTMQQVFSAFVAVDPTTPDEKLGAALMWIFMGNSTLPGALPRGLRLAEFLRQHLRMSEFHEGEEGPEDDDDDFERSIFDILSEKEADELNEMTGNPRRRWLQKKRVTNLGTVVRRLKGGAFLRTGPRYISKPFEDYQDEGAEGQAAEGGTPLVQGAGAGLAKTKKASRKHTGGTKDKAAAKVASRVESASNQANPELISAKKSKAKGVIGTKTKAGKKGKKKKKTQ